MKRTFARLSANVTPSSPAARADCPESVSAPGSRSGAPIGGIPVMAWTGTPGEDTRLARTRLFAAVGTGALTRRGRQGHREIMVAPPGRIDSDSLRDENRTESNPIKVNPGQSDPIKPQKIKKSAQTLGSISRQPVLSDWRNPGQTRVIQGNPGLAAPPPSPRTP